MKTLKSIVPFLLAIILNVSLATAGGAGSITSLVDGKSIILSTQEQSSSEIEVRISDLNGKVLISEDIQVKGLMNRKYDLRKLPDGIYELRIIDALQIMIKRISIDHDDLSIIEESKLIKPRFFMNDKIVTVSFLPFGEKATIRIYDDAGLVLSEEKFKNQNALSKKYDFSSAPVGHYHVTVILNGEVFRHPVNIII